MKDTDKLYSLLSKYFLGECSQSEKDELLLWRNASSKNQEIFHDLEQDWQLIYLTQTKTVIPDKERVWNNILRNVNIEKKQVHTYSRYALLRVACIAALFTLIITYASFSVFQNRLSNHSSSLQKMVVITPSGQKSQIVLPDGTTVWLNSESKLTYPSDFNVTNRNIELEGEAFFDVTKSTEYPFIINAGEVNVKVLGTTFNVKAFSQDEDIYVSLIEGDVSIFSTKNNSLLINLKPNQTGRIIKNNLLCSVTEGDANNQGVWRFNKLYFDNTPSEEVWRKLEYWYGVKIKLINNKPQQTYRFIIKTESLTELLNLINRLTPISYEIDGEEVTVRYK